MLNGVRIMRTIKLTLKLLFITITATVAAYYAIATLGNLNGIHSIGLTDADLIRQRCPIRLIQPEWVSSQPDLLLNWAWAEMKARFGLVVVLWLCGVIVIVRCDLRKPINQ